MFEEDFEILSKRSNLFFAGVELVSNFPEAIFNFFLVHESKMIHSHIEIQDLC